MKGVSTVSDYRITLWWIGFGVGLFLLVPVDLFTTFLAVAEHGLTVEANPVMRWLFEQGMGVLTLAHLLVVGVASYLFKRTVDSVKNAPTAYQPVLVLIVSLWIGLIIAAGMFLFTNNLMVIT